MSPPTIPVRPPYDPELAPLLSASPLPHTITADMIESLRAHPFTAPIEEILSTRAMTRQERTVESPTGSMAVSVFTPTARPDRRPASTTCTAAG